VGVRLYWEGFSQHNKTGFRVEGSAAIMTHGAGFVVNCYGYPVLGWVPGCSNVYVAGE
jgi:hypothetical protein